MESRGAGVGGEGGEVWLRPMGVRRSPDPKLCLCFSEDESLGSLHVPFWSVFAEFSQIVYITLSLGGRAH